MLCKVIEDPYYRHLFKYVNIYLHITLCIYVHVDTGCPIILAK